MSLAGIWSRAPVAAADAARMLQSFAHASWKVRAEQDARGPVAVAEASQAEPGVSTLLAGGVLLAGDLRLHNRAELADILGLSGVDDRALVAAAYRRWGVDFPRYVLGDFGLALWDAHERRLLLVRDTGGACSMFYSVHAGRLAFASHPRALLTLPGFPSQLDERAVVDYLAELPQEEAATLFAAVRRLPPGQVLVVDEERERCVSYFDLEQVAEERLASDRDYAAALHEALSRAVECRLPSSGRLGVMLSGGLDSSSVAALASRVGSPRRLELLTISAIFPDIPECDERSYQAAVVARLGSHHRQLRPDPSDGAGDFAQLCRVFAEPSQIGPHWIAWAAAELATREGATAMMTGIDGDRVVSHGAGRFGDLARARDFVGLGRELAAVHDFDWQRRLRVGAAQTLFSVLPERWAGLLDALDRRQSPLGRLTSTFFRADVLRRTDVEGRLRAQPRRALSTREEHLRTLTAPDRNWDVELLEQLGTAFNLRFEQPFFDRRVVKLCLSMPGSQKRQRGWPRYVLRNAMREELPTSVIERRADASFDEPFWRWARGWLVAQGAQTGQGAKLSNISRYIDAETVSRLLRELPMSPGGGPVDFLWKCVVLSRWLDAGGFRS